MTLLCTAHATTRILIRQRFEQVIVPVASRISECTAAARHCVDPLSWREALDIAKRTRVRGMRWRGDCEER